MSFHCQLDVIGILFIPFIFPLLIPFCYFCFFQSANAYANLANWTGFCLLGLSLPASTCLSSVMETKE